MLEEPSCWKRLMSASDPYSPIAEWSSRSPYYQDAEKDRRAYAGVPASRPAAFSEAVKREK